jgi:hypothetical protein
MHKHAAWVGGLSHSGAIMSTTEKFAADRNDGDPDGTAYRRRMEDRFLGEGLTFDDVLLVPAYSEIHPGIRHSRRS